MALDSYWAACQEYTSKVQPKMPEGDSRHQQELEPLEDPRVMTFYKVHTEDGEDVEEEVKERRGVYHFIQGWLQQNQETGVSVLTILF